MFLLLQSDLLSITTLYISKDFLKLILSPKLILVLSIYHHNHLNYHFQLNEIPTLFYPFFI